MKRKVTPSIVIVSELMMYGVWTLWSWSNGYWLPKPLELYQCFVISLVMRFFCFMLNSTQLPAITLCVGLVTGMVAVFTR